MGEDLAGRYPFRGDLHVHTRSSGGLEAPEIVCANFRKKGYDFIAVTDHNRYFPSLNAMAAYRDVPPEMTIVPGEEVHLPSDPAGGHINDIHIINFGGDYSINALISDDDYCEENAANPRAVIDNPPPRMTTREYFAMVDEYAKTLAVPEDIEAFAYAACHWIFREIHRANGLGIFCHPYWIANVFHIPPQFVDYMMETRPFDAFEVLGGELYYEQNGFQTIQYYEDRMKGRTYPVVGSADSHASVNHPKAHICSTLVFAPENRRDALVASVREGYAVAVDSISTEPRYVGELRLVRYACFLEKEFFPLHDMLCFEEGRAMKDYVCGVAGGKETLAFLHGRMRGQRGKYFAFYR
ncbi:MAG: hypothetical protein FWG37_04000 [Clostridia bacterium]|nr:hypothetical protein [Clostridia bacterium]